ncbi:hypothetical protein Peur_034837 [Populus x canadensis]
MVLYPFKIALLRLQINVTIFYLPHTIPLYHLLSTTTSFQNSVKTTTYRTTPVREQPSSPLSLFLSKRRLKTQTFTDLSLHCYHCRKTQQIHARKGHTSERPNRAEKTPKREKEVSSCLISIFNFFLA